MAALSGKLGTQLSIDETSVSHGELYTIVTNKAVFPANVNNLVAADKSLVLIAEFLNKMHR